MNASRGRRQCDRACRAGLHLRHARDLDAGKKPGVGGVFLPELMLPGYVYIERSAVAAAFDAPGLKEAVGSTGRRTILAAGIATDIGLLYAALGAREEGYAVFAVLDASGTTDVAAEELARHRGASCPESARRQPIYLMRGR